MNVWYHLSTIFNQRVALRIAGLIAVCVALTTTLIFAHAAHAAPGINSTLNFQARLQTASGAVVPDGYYNIQFKIYQDGAGTAENNPGGTLKWTETYINNGGTSGVSVKNGYLSVSLGENNPFGTSVDWNQDTLWLSMNIAGSATNCTTFNSGSCASDGEMLPMKRLTSTPYALNSGQLGGKTAGNFVQLSQGVQEDAANNTSSIHINKTGTDGEFVKFQNAGVDALTINKDGNILFGTGGSGIHGIGVDTAASGQNGEMLAVVAGNGGGGGSDTNGGMLILQGGSGGTSTSGNGGNVMIDGGSTGTEGGNLGSVYIGTASTKEVAIGGLSTEEIRIGTATDATTNVTVGTGASAQGGTTTIQSKDDTKIATNGVDRAVFDTNGNLYLGNGKTSTSPSSFTIQGTSSSAGGVSGGNLTIQGGGATTGNTNGGNLTLSGGTASGTGTNGLVVISTPTFSTTSNDANCYTGGALVASSCTVTASSVNNTSAIIIGFNTASQTATVPDPTNTTAGRIVYITAANGSSDFTLSLNGGGIGNLTSMRQNTSATLIWNGNDWTVAGASNSTTLQSAYNNTLQSAGGAELIVSSGTNANGLTIRDSSTNPVNGTLLEVQNASASTLFSVNSNVPEYASNGGAETAGGTSAEFPLNTWSGHGTGSVARHTPADQYVATGQASVQVTTPGIANAGASNRISTALTPNMTYNVSLGTRLGTGESFTDMLVGYSADGSGTLTTCKSNAVATISSWTKVRCSFKTPASGITGSNAIVIRQVGAMGRTFYVDNLSVTIAGNQNYATDGNVNSALGTNWVSAGPGTVTPSRNIADGQESSDSAQAAISGAAANAGLRNKLSIAPLKSTLYRMSAYVKLDPLDPGTFTDFKMRYSRDGGTNITDCVDYNKQVVSKTTWTEITCYITTDSVDATDPYAYFVQTASTTRTFMVDSFEMNLATNTAANVQIGGGSNGGQTTLFTLDQGASAPISDNNDALLGSMYYDTTLGKIQCYESDGWGACGSSPDNIITISPEYTNAVMNGTGVGTMTSDFCSNTASLTINTSICSSGQTQNYYKWTSPQNDSQTYSIFVTYQLPGTFKSFASGQTILKGRTDNGSNGGAAAVKYTVMKKSGATLTTCGTQVTVSENTETDWKTGTAIGTADPSTCGFAANDSVVFKIDVTANKNAKAYVSDLGFTFSNN